MTFEPKISGTSISDFNITPIFDKQFILLSEVIEKIHRQESMDWILDTLRFTKCNENYPNEWYCTMDWDSIYKLSILENYPNYEKELVDNLGERWMNYYLRFGH